MMVETVTFEDVTKESGIPSLHLFVSIMPSTKDIDSGNNTKAVNDITITTSSLISTETQTTNTSDKTSIMPSTKEVDTGINTKAEDDVTIITSSLISTETQTTNTRDETSIMPSMKDIDSGISTKTENDITITTYSLISAKGQITNTSDKPSIMLSTNDIYSGINSKAENDKPVITSLLTSTGSQTTNSSDKTSIMPSMKDIDSGINTKTENDITIKTNSLISAKGQITNTSDKASTMSSTLINTKTEDDVTIITSLIISRDSRTTKARDKKSLMPSTKDIDSGISTKTENDITVITSSLTSTESQTANSSDKTSIMPFTKDIYSGINTKTENDITIITSSLITPEGQITNTSDKTRITPSMKDIDSGISTKTENDITVITSSLTSTESQTTNSSDKTSIMSSTKDIDSGMHTKTNTNATIITNSIIDQNIINTITSNLISSTSSTKHSDPGMHPETKDNVTIIDSSLIGLDRKTASTPDKISLISSMKNSYSTMHSKSKNDVTIITNSLIDLDRKTRNTNNKISSMLFSKDSDSGIHKVTNQAVERTPSVTTVTSDKTDEENYIDVSLYDLIISYNSTHLWGEIALTIKVSGPLDQIILDFDGVSVSFSSFHEAIASQEKHLLVDLKSMDYDKQRRRIIIELMSKIKPEYSNILSLKFISELSPFERGGTFTTFLTRSVGYQNKQRAWIIRTFLFPNFGKLVFPCIETPERRSIFHLRLNRNIGDEAVSNTLKKKTKKLRKADLMDDFYKTPAIPISSFMLNILPKYDSFIIERTPSLAFWFPPYLKYSVEQIVNIANEILDFFIEYFQYNLPIQQISVVVSEDLYSDPPASFATILISSKYLFEKYESNYEHKENIYHFLAKQFCDLWIGNIVSFNSWDDLWIKEGFSIYMAHLATMDIYDDYDFSSFNMRIQQNAFRYHRLPFFDELYKDELYTNSKMENGTPSKGAFLLHMVYNILKPQPFQEAIRIFFKEWALQSVSADVFWNSFNVIQENIDVKEFINSWAFNYYPTLDVDLENNTVIVKKVQHSDSNNDYNSWWIPISYFTGNDIHFDYTITHWMKQQQSIRIKFRFNDTWIIFNPQYSGFVRFNYSRHLWKMIIIGLRKGTAQLPSSVKAQLLDDAFTLASESFLDYSIPMTMALYLKNEEEYAPWFVALKHFSYLAEVIINYPEWQIFQRYMVGIMSHISLKLQIKTKTVIEKEIQGQLRKILMSWSCMNDLSNGCDKWALKKFLNWKDDPSHISKNLIPTELRSIIYCMGAKFYDDETSKYLYSISQNQMITSGEALRLLRGVTCTSKFMTFMEILNDMFDSNNPAFSFLRLKEFALSLKQSHLNSLLSFRYIKHYWKIIYERFHESNGILHAIIEGATYFLRTKEHYNEVLTLRKSVPESDYSTLASLDLAIDQIVFNINWDARNLNKFRKWLKFYNSTLT